MTKGVKAFFVIVLILIGGLSITSGFLFAKVKTLQNQLVGDTQNESREADSLKSGLASSKDEDATVKPGNNTDTTKTEEKSTTSSVTQAAPLNNRPSSPADTYTVQTGETLSVIAKKFDLVWTEVAEANGITDPNKVKIGQSLIIPKNNQVSFLINKTKADELQKQTDTGKNSFRLSALDTAKSDSSPAYGLLVTDVYKQTSVDKTAGTAVVRVTHGDKTYDIKLTQPVKKGDQGIWAIESIKIAK